MTDINADVLRRALDGDDTAQQEARELLDTTKPTTGLMGRVGGNRRGIRGPARGQQRDLSARWNTRVQGAQRFFNVYGLDPKITLEAGTRRRVLRRGWGK